MNKHNYVRRIGAPGINYWKCQAPECADEGALNELMARECKHVCSEEEMKQNLFNAIES